MNKINQTLKEQFNISDHEIEKFLEKLSFGEYYKLLENNLEYTESLIKKYLKETPTLSFLDIKSKPSNKTGQDNELDVQEVERNFSDIQNLPKNAPLTIVDKDGNVQKGTIQGLDPSLKTVNLRLPTGQKEISSANIQIKKDMPTLMVSEKDSNVSDGKLKVGDRVIAVGIPGEQKYKPRWLNQKGTIVYVYPEQVGLVKVKLDKYKLNKVFNLNALQSEKDYIRSLEAKDYVKNRDQIDLSEFPLGRKRRTV